jgi:hypothetical protein
MVTSRKMEQSTHFAQPGQAIFGLSDLPSYTKIPLNSESYISEGKTNCNTSEI